MIRNATSDDRPLVRELFLEFTREIPDAPHRDDDTEDDLAKLERSMTQGGVVLLAERDGKTVGLAAAEKSGTRVGYLSILYVRPRARGNGVARELVHEVVSRLRPQGVEVLELDVLESNEPARKVYERWGFTPVQHAVGAPLDALE